MTQDFSPSISIIETTKTLDLAKILIHNDSPNSLEAQSQLITIPSLRASSEIDLKIDGFEFLEISKNGEKFISGKIYVRQVLNNTEVLTCISNPKYLFADSMKGNTEQATVKGMKKLISQQWSYCFSNALDQTYKSSNYSNITNSTKHIPIQSKYTQAGKWLTKIISSNKHPVYYVCAALTALMIIGNILIWKIVPPSLQTTNHTTIQSAEQMAIQQDQILNNAFKEIGIDRAKLASDMSCFTE